MNLFESDVYVIKKFDFKKGHTMKKIIITCLGMLFLTCTPAKTDEAKPEKVCRIIYEVKSNEWYQTQATLWKRIIDENPQNAMAWHNYYNAHRYAHFDNLESDEKQAKLKTIIEDMGTHIPESFDYNLMYYWNSHNQKDITRLKKAYELDPSRPDTYYGFISFCELAGQFEKAQEYYQKLYNSLDIAPWLLDYNYNILMSVEDNAILITNGDNDTYPARMLQEAKNERSDVTVVNISMGSETEYLEYLLKQKDLKLT